MADAAILSEGAVNVLYRACLWQGDDDPAQKQKIEGIVGIALLHRKRTHAQRGAIGALLGELPPQFHKSVGGGWSFPNACMDRHGRQWADLHQTMEHLFVLGIATGQARFLMQRKDWAVFPGGLPFVVVDPD